MITIYSANGEIRFETEINTGSRRDKNLNGEDYVMLKFSVARPVPFAVGDYADIPGEGRMVVISVPQPTYNKTTGGFDYELRLEPEWALFANKLLKLNPASNAEVEFKLTDTLANHLRMALKCISASNLQWHDAAGEAHDYTFEISDDTDIVPDDARYIAYASTDILSGLREMASVFECECWIEDGVIHFGKNEHGDIVQFERDDNVVDITPSGRDGARPNRLYAFGGTENIPPYYRKEMIFHVTNKDVKSDGRIFISDQDHPLKLDMFPASMQVADPNRTISFNELKEIRTMAAKDLPYNQSYTFIYNSATIKGLGHGSYTVRLSKWNPTVNLPHNAFQFSGDLTFYYTDTDGKENYRRLMLPPKVFETSGQHQFGWDDFILSLPNDSDVRIAICIYCKKTDKNIVLGDVIMQYGLFPMYFDSMTTYVSVEGITVTTADGAKISGAAINSGHNPFTGIIPLELPAGSAIEVGDAFRLPDILRSRIPASWFTAENVEDVIDAVASNRLRLPYDTPYIDANDSVTDATAIEHVEIFDDVYPKQDNTINEIWSYEASTANNDGSTTTEWYYCINDSKLKFSADCMIPGVDLRVKFTSGLLNGMTFQVEWLQYGKYETDNKPAFEIVVNEDFGRRLPNTVLRPKKGDKFILLGWADDTLYDLLIHGAELKLKGKAREWMEANHAEGETYDCPMIPEKAKEWMPVLGQRVRLNDAALFPSGSFVSRVIGLQYPLDIPFDSPTVIVGNKIPKKRLEGVEEQIKALGKIDDYTIPEVATNIGASTIECVLTNQSDTIVFDTFGTAIGALPSTSVRVWANGVRYNNFALSLDGDYYGLGLSIDGDTLRVTSADLNIEDNTSVGINVAINAGGAVIERKLIFSLLKRRGDMRYQLQPSHTSIRVVKSKALYPTPENLSCGILAVGNGSSEIISAADGYTAGLQVEWRMITGTDQSHWVRDVPQYDASTTMLQCRLMQDNECIDIQSIPLIEDGTDGIDGKDGTDGTNGQGSVNSYVFCLSAQQPATPTGGSYTSLVPDGWSDGFPADPEDDNFGLSVWMSRRIFTSDGLPPQETEWTEPVLFGNNSHQQMMYSTADEQPPSPAVDESAWDDEASRETVWMAMRHRVNAMKNPGWSDWSIIRIKGEKGKDGRGIVSVTEEYAVSGSPTTAPADASFSTSIPAMTDSLRYLWNREKTKFTDNSTVTTTPIVIGVKGQNGEAGATVVSVTNYYLASASASGVTAGTSGWVTDPTHANATISAEKPCLWNYEVTKWSKGADTSTKPHVVGRFGKDGADGKDGRDGVTMTKNSTTYSTAHTEAQPADSTFTLNAVPVLTPGQWLWAKAEVAYSNGQTTKTYSVSRIGANGTNGTNGTSVSVKSTSVTYAKSTTATQPADSQFVYSSIAAAEIKLGEYLWTKSTTTFTDNKSLTSYTVSRIGSDGANGQSIQGPKGDTYYVHLAYCDSISGTLPNPTSVTGFSTTATANSAYLGTCTDRAELDPTDHKKYKWSKIKGEDGADGKDGVSMTSTSVTYSTVNTASRPADSTFTLAEPPAALVAGKYLWSRTTVAYSDGKSTNAYAVSRIGADGLPGTSVSVASSSVTYAKSSGLTQPAASAFTATSIGALNAKNGDYIWSKTTVTYTDGKSTTGYSVSRIGADGADGVPGVGIDGKTYYFHQAYANNSTGTSGFSVTYFDGADYMGTCSTLQSADPTDPAAYVWARIKGDKGRTPLVNADGSITFKESPTSSELLASSKNMMANFNKADKATTAANEAKTEAGSAKSTANNAATIANEAKTTADGKASLADVKNLQLSDFSKFGSSVATKTETAALQTAINGKASLADVKGLNLSDFSKFGSSVATKNEVSNHVSSLQTAINGKVSMKQVEDKGYVTIEDVEAERFVRIENASSKILDNLKLIDAASGGLAIQACGREKSNTSIQKPEMCFLINGGSAGLTETEVNALVKAYAAPLSHSHSQYLTSASLTNYVTTNTAQSISALKTFTAGLQVSGRIGTSGDGEGIVVPYHSNNWAGLCLGNVAGERSVFYKSKGSAPFWRYNNGSTNFDVYHPAKSGTIALTSDLGTCMRVYGSSSGLDWNTVKTNGSYYVAQSSTNKPNSYGQMLVMRNNDTTTQLYIPYANSQNMMFRGMSDAGGWFSWKTVLDSHNYASFLDGRYALASSLSNYVTRNTTQEITAVKTFAADIYFKGVEDSSSSATWKPVASYGLYWQGSSDTCRLYWNCPNGNDGTLHINHTDDGDEAVAFEWNGAASYRFSKLALDAPSVHASFAVIKKTGSNASQALMGDGTVRTVHTLTSVTNLGWSGTSGQLATINTLAHWNGAYVNTTSNLQYCAHGRFGTMAVQDASSFARGGMVESISIPSGGQKWVRIAQSSSYSFCGIITIINTYHYKPTSGVSLVVHGAYRNATVSIAQIGGYPGLFLKARLVYPTASNDPYYIEVLVSELSGNNPYYARLANSRDLSLLTTYTAGAVPSGYAVKEIALTDGMSATNFVGRLIGNADSASVLQRNSRMDYGWDGLNYFNVYTTAGCVAKANDTPTTQWWHILRFNHANTGGYYTDLAVPFNENSIYYKRVQGGTVANGKWVKVLDELNYAATLDSRYPPYYWVNNALANYLPLTGGTLSGNLTINGRSDRSLIINHAGDGEQWHLIQFSSKADVYIGYNSVNNVIFSSKDINIGAFGNTVWHRGNDGSGSGLDADLLDGHQETEFFRNNIASISTDFIDLTDTNKNATGYANYRPGTYGVSRSGYSDLFVNLAHNSGSTSALQFLTSYADNASLRFRKTIDSNRISGPWRTIVTDVNFGTYIAANASLLDSRYVTLNGNQTISGEKNFSKFVRMSDGTRGLIFYSNLRNKAGAIEILGANNSWAYDCLEFETNGDLTAKHSFTAKTIYTNDIAATDTNGLLAYKPASWMGVNNTQWGVGAVNCVGVIRSSNANLIHYRNGVGASTIVDSGNITNHNVTLSRINGNLLATIGGVQITCYIEDYVTHTELLGEPGPSTNKGILGDYVKEEELDSIYDKFNSYLPLAGGTITGNLTAKGLLSVGGNLSVYGNATFTAGNITLNNAKYLQVNGEAGRVCLFNQSGVSVNARPDNGGSVVQFVANKADGKTALGAACGVFLNANAVQYFYYGGSWDAPLMKLHPSGQLDAKTALIGKLYIATTGNQPYLYAASGSIYIQNTTSRIDEESEMWGFQYHTSSDLRLKAVARYISPDIRDIAAARAVEFNWLKNGRADCGCIAQDWQHIIPMVVVTDKHSGTLSMDYGKAALISAIAIARKVVSHEDRLAVLERENIQLKARVNELESKLQITKI